MEPLSKVVDLTVTAQAATSTVSFDENTGVLTLEAGTVNAADVKLYRSNTAVTKVVAQAGAVLPEDCSSLFEEFKAQDIDLSNADSSNVENISLMFGHDVSLKYIFVSDKWNIDNVTEPYNIFYNCPNLVGENGTSYKNSHIDYETSATDKEYARIDRPGTPGYLSETADTVSFDESMGILTLKSCYIRTEDVTAYRDDDRVKKVVCENRAILPQSCMYLFSHFKANEIDFSNADTSNVTTMYGMFSGCESLKNLDLSGFDTQKVTDMSNMFRNCQSLKTLDLSNFDTSKATSTNYMFTPCSSLEEITLDFSITEDMYLPNGSYYWVKADVPNTIVSGTGDYAVIDVSGKTTLTRVKVVQFNVGGKGITPANQFFTDAESYKVSKPTPTAEGYTFLGWFTDDTYTEYFDFDTPITKSTTLYAKWLSANGENTITLSDFVESDDIDNQSKRIQSVNFEEAIVCEMSADVQDCNMCGYIVMINDKDIYKELSTFNSGYTTYTIDKHTQQQARIDRLENSNLTVLIFCVIMLGHDR